MRSDVASALDTDIYAFTGEEFSCGRNNLEITRELIAAGIKIIQYREKTKTARERYREASLIRELTGNAGVILIVNDYIDLALAVEADGIHLGQDDLPLAKARELVGDRLFIGLSTHSPEQARQAVIDGADYIGVGPLYPTFTKVGAGPAVGLKYLNYVVATIAQPFVAIGGINEDNIAEVRRHGARLIAMVTEILRAGDITAKVESLRQRLACTTLGEFHLT